MRILTTLAALTALIALPACTSEASSAAGTYTVTIDTTGMPEQAAAMMKKMMTFGDLNLGGDGNWDMSTEMDMMGNKQTSTVKGTWKLEGGEVHMTATHEDGKPMEKEETVKGAYKDGAFSLEMEEGGQKFKMDMKRK